MHHIRRYGISQILHSGKYAVTESDLASFALHEKRTYPDGPPLVRVLKAGVTSIGFPPASTRLLAR